MRCKEKRNSIKNKRVRRRGSATPKVMRGGDLQLNGKVNSKNSWGNILGKKKVISLEYGSGLSWFYHNKFTSLKWFIANQLKKNY